MTTQSDLHTLLWFRLLLFGVLVGFAIGSTYNVEIQPENGPLFKLVGTSLELNCTVKDGAQWLSWKFFYNQTGKEMESRILNENTSTLFIDNISENQTGTYACFLNDTFQDYRSVRVGYPPEPPADFYCVSHDYMDLICKWKIHESKYAEKWTLSYRSMFSGCVDVFPNCSDKHACSYHWPSAGDDKSTSLVKSFENTSYFVKIVGESKFGNTSFEKDIDPKRIVKMSRLKSVNVAKESSTSTSLKLSWQLSDQSEMLPYLFVINYRILYKSKWDNSFKQAFLVSPFDSSNTMTLTNLVPNTLYNISVSAKIDETVGEQYWSDPYITTGTTEFDVPGALPEFTTSSFQIAQQITSNTIKIYMKPLSEKMKNSPTVKYSLIFEELNKNREKVSSETRTYPESVTIHPDVELNLDHEYKIKIQVFNEIGTADGTGILHLSSSFSEYIPDHVMVEKDSLRSRYLVSWFKDDLDTLSIATVTYYWCKQGKGDNVCHENLNWSIKPFNTTSLFINVDDEENIDDWIFGVSLEKNDNVSSGICWENCQFSHFDHVDEIPPPSFFTVQSVRGNGKTLEVKITGYCYVLNNNLLNVRPENYTIMYGKVSDNVTTKIEKSAKRNDITIILSDLEPYTQYFVVMKTGTRAGYSKFTSQKIVRTEMIAPSTPPKEIKAENITGSAFTLTWVTTDIPNGPIISYELTLQDSVREIMSVSLTPDVFSYTFNNLDGYTNFTARIKACNEAGCSPAGSIHINTLAKAPEGLKFDLEKIADNRIGILIQGPMKPNAPEYFYRLKLTKVQENLQITEKIYDNITEKIVNFTFSCTNNTKSFKIAVDAIGTDENGNLYEPQKKFLEEKEIDICPAVQKAQDTFPLIAGFIGGLVALVFIVLIGCFIYYSVKKYRNYDPEIAVSKIISSKNLCQNPAEENEEKFSTNIEIPELKKDDNYDNNNTLRVNSFESELSNHVAVDSNSGDLNEKSGKPSKDYVLVDNNGQIVNNCSQPDPSRMHPGIEGEANGDNVNDDVVIFNSHGNSAVVKCETFEKLNQEHHNSEQYASRNLEYITKDELDQLKSQVEGMVPDPCNHDTFSETDTIKSLNQCTDINKDQQENCKIPAIELSPLKSYVTLETTNNAQLTQNLNSVQNTDSEENCKMSAKEEQSSVTEYVTNQFPSLNSSSYSSKTNSSNSHCAEVSAHETKGLVSDRLIIDGIALGNHGNNNMSASVINMIDNEYSNSNQSDGDDVQLLNLGTQLQSIYLIKSENSVTGTLSAIGSPTDELYYRMQDENILLGSENSCPVPSSLSDETTYYKTQNPDKNLDKNDQYSGKNYDFDKDFDNPGIDSIKHSYDSSEHGREKIEETKNGNHINSNQEHYIKLQGLSQKPDLLKQISVIELENEDSSISPVSTISRSSNMKDQSETDQIVPGNSPKFYDGHFDENFTEDPYISSEQANKMCDKLLKDSDTESQKTTSPTANIGQKTDESSTDYISDQITADNNENYGQSFINTIEKSTVAKLLSDSGNASPRHKTTNCQVPEQSDYLSDIQNGYGICDNRRTAREEPSHLQPSSLTVTDSPYVRDTFFNKVNVPQLSNNLDLNSNPLPNNSIQSKTGQVYSSNMTSANGYVPHSQITIEL